MVPTPVSMYSEESTDSYNLLQSSFLVDMVSNSFTTSFMPIYPQLTTAFTYKIRMQDFMLLKRRKFIVVIYKIKMQDFMLLKRRKFIVVFATIVSHSTQRDKSGMCEALTSCDSYIYTVYMYMVDSLRAQGDKHNKDYAHAVNK